MPIDGPALARALGPEAGGAAEVHSLLDSAEGGELDGGPVGQWVAERYPELEDVRARIRESAQDG